VENINRGRGGGSCGDGGSPAAAPGRDSHGASLAGPQPAASGLRSRGCSDLLPAGRSLVWIVGKLRPETMVGDIFQPPKCLRKVPPRVACAWALRDVTRDPGAEPFPALCGAVESFGLDTCAAGGTPPARFGLAQTTVMPGALRGRSDGLRLFPPAVCGARSQPSRADPLVAEWGPGLLRRRAPTRPA